jgi:VanZ family protein
VLNKKTLIFFAVIWTVLITILSLITVEGIKSTIAIPHKDKMVHFVFYFVFVLLWFSVKKASSNLKKISQTIFLLAVGYGLLMEFLQNLLTDNRTGDVLDVLANTLGALMALLYINYKFLNKTQV